MNTIKPSHTPIPWKLWQDQDPKEPLQIVGPSGDFICQLTMENTQVHQNKLLIAAAPELLALLQEAAYPGGLSEAQYSNWLPRARAAIAKALPTK